MPDGHHISCPNGGKKYGKETPFVGGLRSPLTIPESDPVEIPFRTVGRLIRFDQPFSDVLPSGIVKRKEVYRKIRFLLRNRSPPKRFKSGGQVRFVLRLVLILGSHLIRRLWRHLLLEEKASPIVFSFLPSLPPSKSAILANFCQFLSPPFRREV